jgi:hypothetical protein
MNIRFSYGEDPVPVEIWHRDGQVETHLNLEACQILDGTITGYSPTGLTLFSYRVQDLQGVYSGHRPECSVCHQHHGPSEVMHIGESGDNRSHRS